MNVYVYVFIVVVPSPREDYEPTIAFLLLWGLNA
jgi:hypothetical protein